MAVGQLMWHAVYDDGSEIDQLAPDKERSVLELDHKKLRKLYLYNLRMVRVYELGLPPGHRLIFRRRVMLRHGTGTSDTPANTDKVVVYLIGWQETSTGKLWYDVLDDDGKPICGADGFDPGSELLRPPVFLPQEGIILGDLACSPSM